MSDCRFGVSSVNYPDPDPEGTVDLLKQSCCIQVDQTLIIIKLRAKCTCFVTQ